MRTVLPTDTVATDAESLLPTPSDVRLRVIDTFGSLPQRNSMPIDAEPSPIEISLFPNKKRHIEWALCPKKILRFWLVVLSRGAAQETNLPSESY